jgi:hypothetical protein
VSEGEEEGPYTDTTKPLPTTPAQRLALEIVDLVVVDVDAIDVPIPKTKEQKALEITRDIVRTSFVTDCIKVAYLSSSCDDDSSSSSELEESEVQQGRAIKTDLADDPDDNSWNVTVKDAKGKAKTLKVTEKELLGGEFVIERAYNDVTAEKKKGMIAKNKRMRQREARKQEIKLAELARKKRK